VVSKREDKKIEIMKKILCILALTATTMVSAQVGIGTITPNPDSALEVASTDKGLLVPRIALTGTANTAPLSAHIRGMMIYNIATASDVTPGYYVNDGTKWVMMAVTISEPWRNPDGSAAVYPISTDINYMNGNLGIGTSTPTEPLHIVKSTPGAIRIQDGTEGQDKILSSDANGVASWVDSTTSAAPIESTGVSLSPIDYMVSGSNASFGKQITLTRGKYFIKATARVDMTNYKFPGGVDILVTNGTIQGGKSNKPYYFYSTKSGSLDNEDLSERTYYVTVTEVISVLSNTGTIELVHRAVLSKIDPLAPSNMTVRGAIDDFDCTTFFPGIGCLAFFAIRL